MLVAELDQAAGQAAVEEVTAAGGTARFVRTDVGDRDQVEAMVATAVDTRGSIDVLVNNAWSAAVHSRVEHDDAARSHSALGGRPPISRLAA